MQMFSGDQVWLAAVIPCAGLTELTERLSVSDRTVWSDICMEHAEHRAEELCHIMSNDELSTRDGNYWWTHYNVEFRRALNAVNGLRRQPYIDHAEVAFVTAVNLIRRGRLSNEGSACI